ncbi:MAG: acyltransferase family protein [Paracoccaceae bacterium]
MSLKYRPEIDGLRAVAVLAVIFYHAEFSIGKTFPFKGGFIGVDVFFVISGYLITSIILKDLRAGNFSFARFYERRARRILPALFTVMACSAPFAWLYMLPKAMKEFAGSIVSDIWFLQEGSYAAGPSALKPFLHTWSLSVEEQFYVIYPAALFLIWKYARSRFTALATLGLLVSLQLAQYGSDKFPDADFYLLPTRGWELLAGAILAKFELEYGRESHPVLNATMPAVGLFLTLHAFVFFDDQMNHPAFVTVLPVLGTMLIIWFARQGEIVTDILGSRLFVGIGLISYSLYLWHFPLFAFRRIAVVDAPTLSEKFSIIAVSFLLSVITYLLIEKNARNMKLVRKKVFVPVIISSFAGLVIFNAAVFRGDGLPSRLGEFSDVFEEAKEPELALNGVSCHNREFDKRCSFGEGDRNIIMMGDSHGKVLDKELLRMAQSLGYGYITHTLDSCPYLGPGVSVAFRGRALSNCNIVTRLRREFLLNQPPSVVVLAGRFPAYFSGRGFNNEEGGVEPRTGPASWQRQVVPGKTSELRKVVTAGIEELLNAGHTVVILFPVPEVGWHVPLAVKSKLNNVPVERYMEVFQNINISTSYEVYRNRSKKTRDVFDWLDGKNLIKIYPEKLFCSSATNRCYTHDSSHLYYSDDDHLSGFGARMIADEIRKALIARERYSPESAAY